MGVILSLPVSELRAQADGYLNSEKLLASFAANNLIALYGIETVDEQLSRLIELRFFGGLTVQETARVLGVSPSTVKRLWRLGKGWLHREITEGT